MFTPLFFRYRSMANHRAGGRPEALIAVPECSEKFAARDILQADGVAFGEGMVLGQIDLERFLTKKEILQPGTSILLAKKPTSISPWESAVAS